MNRHHFLEQRPRVVRQPVFERLEDRSLLALVIDPGTILLLPDTAQQAIPIQVTRSAPATDPLVTGFNLRAQLGDGLGPAAEPVFEAIQFGGGIWDAFATTTVGGPVPGSEQFAQASVLFNLQGQAVAAEGLVVTLIVSTVGISQGSYDLRLTNTQIGANTDFIGLQGTSIQPATSLATINILSHPWQNPIDRFDVNADTRVTPLDALMVINDINARGSRALPIPPLPPVTPPPYLDVNGDDFCSPADVLQVVNLLNERAASAQLESEPPPPGPSATAEGEPLAHAVLGSSEVAYAIGLQVPGRQISAPVAPPAPFPTAPVGGTVVRSVLPTWPLAIRPSAWPTAFQDIAADSLTPSEARDILFHMGLELGEFL